MSHPRSYVWPSVVIGLLIALVVIQGTKLYHASKVEPCQCKPVASCSCPEVTPCTCDHAVLLELHAALEASIGELRVSVEALEDRASDGESKVLTGYKGILEQFQNIQRRLDKLEGRKPPVRRQASCGAHPPSCEGIAALGADGEPDSVTGIHLCTAEPWYPGKQLTEWYQAERLASLKRRQERIEKRKLLLQFLFGACA